jgi:hypothetical protein
MPGVVIAKVKPPASSTNPYDLVMQCEVCGNDYDKPLEIIQNGESHFFDCFECAIHALAPECDHCGCQIIGHGIEAGGNFFCCANCAHHEGVMAVSDRA